MTDLTHAWHVDADLLRAYIEDTVPMPVAAAVEQHIVRCETCRSRCAAAVDRGPLERVWDAMALDLVASPQPWGERLAARLGLSPSDALLIAAAPAARGAWLLAVMASLAFAALAASSGPQALSSLLFLWTAPLVPVLAVALAFGGEADPTWEVTLAAPYPPVRHILLRAAVVVATTLPLALLVATLLPGPSWVAVAWLLPSLAGVTVVLAGSTWYPVSHVATAWAVVWLLVTGGTASPRVGDALLALSVDALPVYVAIAIVAGAVFVFRIDRLNLLGRNS